MNISTNFCNLNKAWKTVLKKGWLVLMLRQNLFTHLIIFFICENILTTFSLPDIKLLQLTLHPQQTEIYNSKMVLDH